MTTIAPSEEIRKPMERYRFDVVALAKRINARRQEWNRLHPDRPIRITSLVSRILENDPDYIPARRRAEGKRQRPVINPSIRSLLTIADALGTTVGDLLEEPWPLSPAERMIMRRTVRIIGQLIARSETNPQREFPRGSSPSRQQLGDSPDAGAGVLPEGQSVQCG